MKDKSALRLHYLGLLKNQTVSDRQHKSQVIAHLLGESPLYQQAKVIMFYAALAYEVDTFGMMRKALKDGKHVCLPVVEKTQRLIIPVLMKHLDEIQPSTYGIAEPPLDATRVVAIEQLDAVVVPGLAFDASRHRLGRGAGYYDRFLAQLPMDTPTIGLAFDFQQTQCLPIDSHDIALMSVLAS